MIEILERSDKPGAGDGAAFICDACRKQVVGSGNIIWGCTVGIEPQLSTPLFVAHKGGCDVAVQRTLEERYVGEQWVWLWEDVGPFTKTLMHNLTNSFADDRQGTYHKQRVAFPPEAR